MLFLGAIHGGVSPCFQMVAAEVVVGGSSYADARLNCQLTIAHGNRLSLYLDLPQSILPFCGML
jgi:hypothetical protein